MSGAGAAAFGRVLLATGVAVACLVVSACGASGSSGASGGTAATGDAALAAAFASKAHDVEVQGEGTVVRVLADDVDGNRHQRFILRLASGQTLLVAHNIDVAPRVEDLQPGDTVAFRGVYEWSAEGGTVHWTHRDPDGRHAAGWLRHDGQPVRLRKSCAAEVARGRVTPHRGASRNGPAAAAKPAEGCCEWVVLDPARAFAGHRSRPVDAGTS